MSFSAGEADKRWSDHSYHADQVGSMNKEATNLYISELQRSDFLQSDILFIIKIGIALRNAGDFARADQIFTLCLEQPSRFAALYELGVSKAHQGSLTEAVKYLETRMRETGMMPCERIFLALQYGRLGRMTDAHDELTDVAALQPDLLHECLTTWQSLQFMNRFDKNYTIGLLEDVKSKFMFYTSSEDVEESIRSALFEEKPLLLLRMGDGEGASIRLSLEDTAAFNLLYNSNLSEFTEIWFGSPQVASNPDFQNVLRDFNTAIRDADLLGCIHVEGIEQEYKLGSRRGITWAANTLRFLMNGECLPGRPPIAASIGDPNIHYRLYASGGLERLIRSQKRIGLITCHEHLRDIFIHHFGIAVDFIKTPGEKIHSHILGETAVEGTHWPDRYQQIRDEIARLDCKAQLFLVAAGMLGKVYASDLKRRGAVVVDIGSVADAMVGRTTRIFPSDVSRTIV